MFSIPVLPHSPGVVCYHLLLIYKTRIPRVAPWSFRIPLWDLCVPLGGCGPLQEKDTRNMPLHNPCEEGNDTYVT